MKHWRIAVTAAALASLLAFDRNSVSQFYPGEYPANTVSGTLAGGLPGPLTTIPTATMPALTGDVTTSAGTVATTIAPAAVTGSKIAANTVALSNVAQGAANTTLCNPTSGTANFQACTGAQLHVNVAPTIQGRNQAARFGSMDVWQRGAGGSASIAVAASTTAYTVDGCYLATGANEASTVAAVAGIAAGSFKAAAVTRNSGQTGTASMVFGCPLDTDEIEQFSGLFVALSFTASTGANWSPSSGNLTYELFCGTGSVKKQTTGYTGQTTPINATQSIPAGSAAARYQSTSAAIVPANCTQAEIQFNWTPVGTAGAADTVTIDDVQFEIVNGSTDVASTYQHLDFNGQLLKAQRHYAKTFPYGTAPAQNAGFASALQFINQSTTAVMGITWQFPVTMRATPAITSFNPAAANANCRNQTASADLTVTVDPQSINAGDRVFIQCGVPAAVAAVLIHATADAGI